MKPAVDVVITGVGVVSPIGIGSEPYWNAMLKGQSGVRALDLYDGSELAPPLGGEVADFDPNQFIPRKQKKVMSRDIQLGFAAAELACRQAGVQPGTVDPERLGVIYGADMIAAELPELQEAFGSCTIDGRFDFSLWGQRVKDHLFPLWMLKYLPNMPACHIAIAQDARGPNNSITLSEASSLAAVIEATQAIRRGQADLMLAGGASSRLHPCVWLRCTSYQLSSRTNDPAGACRPFDADRDGLVFGEGAAAFVLENRRHAEARGAQPLARIAGAASTHEARRPGMPVEGEAVRRAIQAALSAAGLQPSDLGHVNAHGVGTTVDDRIEARAIRDTLGDVPVTAPKSYFGDLCAATGAVEMVASLLALEKGLVPPTLNYRRPDPECPVRVVAGGAIPLVRPAAMVLNHARTGQAVAVVLAAP